MVATSVTRKWPVVPSIFIVVLLSMKFFLDSDEGVVSVLSGFLYLHGHVRVVSIVYFVLLIAAVILPYCCVALRIKTLRWFLILICCFFLFQIEYAILLQLIIDQGSVETGSSLGKNFNIAFAISVGIYFLLIMVYAVMPVENYFLFSVLVFLCAAIASYNSYWSWYAP